MSSGDASRYAPLNASDELHSAAKERPARPPESRKAWPRFPGNVGQNVRMLHTVAKHAPMFLCRELVVAGRERHSGQPLTVRYVGTATNLPYVLNLALEAYETVSERRLPTPVHAVAAFAPGKRDEDVLFLDTQSLIGDRLVSGPHLPLPAWIRQRLPLAAEWPAVIDELPRFTRRGVSRYLRKYGFTGRVAWADDAIDHFYHRLYAPHVVRRHKDEAVVLTEARFRTLARGCRLVEILHDGDVIGANLIRQSGDTMFILWCGVSDLAHERDLKGVTDVLDYFSMLHAFMSGCLSLDFGRSRPTLNDGVMMYKSKWRARLIPARFHQANIVAVPTRWSPSVKSLLAHNHFVTTGPGGLRGRILLDGPPAGGKGIEELVETYCPPGLSSVRIVSIRGFENGIGAVERGPERIELVDLRGNGDPLSAYLAE